MWNTCIWNDQNATIAKCFTFKQTTNYDLTYIIIKNICNLKSST
jgi:hypothetical protein